MKVADLQKCLRSLGEVISAKGAAAKEFTDAADALTPFADYKMEQFAAFLKLAEAKYGASGELPDGKPPKATPARRPAGGSVPRAPAPTVDELLAAVDALKVRLRTDHSLTRDGVESELKRFGAMKQADLFAGAARLGMKTKPKNMADAMKMIINHTVAAQSGYERSDA